MEQRFSLIEQLRNGRLNGLEGLRALLVLANEGHRDVPAMSPHLIDEHGFPIPELPELLRTLKDLPPVVTRLLHQALRSDDRFHRARALTILGDLGPLAEAFIFDLLEARQDPCPNCSQAATEALSKLGSWTKLYQNFLESNRPLDETHIAA